MIEIIINKKNALHMGRMQKLIDVTIRARDWHSCVPCLCVCARAHVCVRVCVCRMQWLIDVRAIAWYSGCDVYNMNNLMYVHMGIFITV
jgi:hypothetical protein